MRISDWSSDVCSSDRACAIVLVLVIRPQRVTGTNLSEDAPTHFVPMADSLQSSNVVAALDPRVDVESDVSFEPVDEGVSAGDQDHDSGNGQHDTKGVDPA